MFRGPKPTPTHLKELAGNPGKRPLNADEPTPPVGAPEKPPHLNEDASVVWDWLVGMLGNMGILCQSDVAIMMLYCDTVAEYVKAKRDLNRVNGFVSRSEKTGQYYINPYMSVLAMLKNQLTRYLAELGLSPTSRSRVKRTPESSAPDSITELLTQRYGRN
ncbi:MAG TPA: phage terminase small subunit P27 family [Thermoguttaceae bacterium]|nr:phage terminase small subunit P27 family [Thermoguttaceae bacterium]